MDRNNGLPGNQVHRLAQDRQGRLWLAGSSGLYCYDGSRVRAFDRRHGLRCAGLRTVAVGADETVWFGTDQGVEALGADGHALTGLAAVKWSFGLVSVIVAGRDAVWLGTAHGLVQIVDPLGSPRLGLQFDVGYVHDLFRLDDDRLIVVSGHLGLLSVDSAGCRAADLPPGLVPTTMRRLAAAEQGLAVGGSGGVQMFDRELRALGPWLNVPSEALVGAVAIREGQLWVGAGRELLGYEHIDGGPPREIFRASVPGIVNDLLVDAGGNIFIATDTAGVFELSALKPALQIMNVSAPIYVIHPGPAGTLVVGGAGFAASLDMGVGTPQPLALLGSTVWDLTPDSVGRGWWLATQGGLFRLREGEAPQRFDADSELLAAPCRVVILRDGELWVGTLRGLVRLRGGVAEPVTGDDGLPLGYVCGLQVDAQDRLWVGTLGRGLWREGADGLAQVTGGPLTAAGNTYVVAFGPVLGRVLVVQDDRIVLLDGEGEPRLICTEPPIGGWTGLWLDEWRVAIGSGDGLRILNVTTGEVELRVNALYGPNFWEFTSTRSLLRAGDGRLYCGVEGGLVAVDLDALACLRAPPEVKLGAVQWQGAEARSEDDWTVVAPGKWSFELQVFAAWWLDPRLISFRFRLVGFEVEWSAASSLGSVHYSSLPPGEYLLQVQAQTPLTGPGETLTALRLRVPARPLAAWVHAAAALYEQLFGLALRNRRLLKRHAELEAEVRARRRAEAALEGHRVNLEQAVSARTQELMTTRDLAQRANQAKSEFLSHMSHELRTPLNAILGFSQLMAEDTSLGERHRRYVDETLRAGRHLLTQINEVLDLAHIESGRMSLEVEPVELGPLVDEGLRMVAPAAQRRRITLESATPSGLAVRADRTRLGQVLLNLLSNAVKYNRDGGQVWVTAEPAGTSWVRLNVRDSGRGIAPERQSELFQPFNRLGAEYGEIEGSGIGLAIVRQVVELMGGTVGVHSEPEVGSTFWLELHAAPLPAVQPARRDPEPARRHAVSRRGCLLYVEDNEVNQLLMASLVERHPGLRLVVAGTAAAGLRLACTVRPDLLLLDLNLPDQDGFALLSALRADPGTAGTPAIAVTAYAMPEDIARSRDAGFVDHLVKPIDIGLFDRLLEQWLPAASFSSVGIRSGADSGSPIP